MFFSFLLVDFLPFTILARSSGLVGFTSCATAVRYAGHPGLVSRSGPWAWTTFAVWFRPGLDPLFLGGSWSANEQKAQVILFTGLPSMANYVELSLYSVCPQHQVALYASSPNDCYGPKHWSLPTSSMAFLFLSLTMLCWHVWHMVWSIRMHTEIYIYIVLLYMYICLHYSMFIVVCLIYQFTFIAVCHSYP